MKKIPKGFIAVCIIPTVVLTVIFMLIPTLEAFRLSFTNATGMSTNNKYIGLENYTYMFHDKMFLLALKNTLKLMLVVPIITLLFSFILAFVLTQSKLPEKGFYRAIYFFPSVISLTVVGIVWSFIFHPSSGTINNVLNHIGLDGLTHAWLGESKTALWCIAITLIWQAVGYYMVMYVAAIDGISKEIFEAATMDGAGALRKLTNITLPLLKNMIGITFVLSLSGTVNLSFILSTIMTNGGPSGSSAVLLQYMYSQAFTNSNFGYAMAIAVFTLGISVILSIISRRLSNKQE